MQGRFRSFMASTRSNLEDVIVQRYDNIIKSKEDQRDVSDLFKYSQQGGNHV